MEEMIIPKDTKVEINGDIVKVSGKLGTNERHINDSLVNVKLDGDKLTIEPTTFKKLKGKADKSLVTTLKEIQNDVDGVNEYFEAHMEIVFSHFPITVEVNGNKLMIKNMLGERVPRECNIVGNTKVEVKSKSVRLYGTKKDDVMQTAANIRTITKVKHKDERIFQDGIYFALEG